MIPLKTTAMGPLAKVSAKAVAGVVDKGAGQA